LEEGEKMKKKVKNQKKGEILGHSIEVTEEQKKNLMEGNDDIYDFFKRTDEWMNAPSLNGSRRLR